MRWGLAHRGLTPTATFSAALRASSALSAADFARPPEEGKAAEDELPALIASEGVSVGDVVSDLIDELAKTQAGQETLQHVARKHAGVLLPAGSLREIADQLDGVKAKLLGAARRTA